MLVMLDMPAVSLATLCPEKLAWPYGVDLRLRNHGASERKVTPDDDDDDQSGLIIL